MLLAIDLGNTFIKLGAMEDQRVRNVSQIQTQRAGELDRLWPKSFDVTFDDVAVSSVSPPAEKVLLPWLERRYGKPPLVLGKDVIVPLKIACEEPRKVGQDRLAISFAAYLITRKTTIVVGLGTALTFDVISGEGSYLGGAIGPGPATAARALNQFTALLPLIEVKRPLDAIGPNTVQAMRSGIYWGTVGAIEEILARIRAELPEDPMVLATGGQAGMLSNECKSIHTVVPHLALMGIAASYQSWASVKSRQAKGQAGTEGCDQET